MTLLSFPDTCFLHYNISLPSREGDFYRRRLEFLLNKNAATRVCDSHLITSWCLVVFPPPATKPLRAEVVLRAQGIADARRLLIPSCKQDSGHGGNSAFPSVVLERKRLSRYFPTTRVVLMPLFLFYTMFQLSFHFHCSTLYVQVIYVCFFSINN